MFGDHKSSARSHAHAARIVRMGAVLAVLCLYALPGWPQQPQPTPDLAEKTLEDLMNVEVTSVSKTAEPLSRTAAAIFVITQEDIRRSGATNIPDLLRMVPGMDVAQIDSNTWAISARGLNGEFSNELLVLLDGRNLYTPTFGGVFWDVADVPLEDIERIEVIRGPGGSLWGANAVDGVVNIITKKTADTHGAMVVTGGGNVEEGFGTVQYGGSLGANTDFRVYAKYLNQNHFPGAGGQGGADGWHQTLGGFRVDSKLTPKDSLTVEGDIYTGRDGQPTFTIPSIISPAPVRINDQVDLAGGYLQTVWNHTYSSRSDSTLTVSYDTYERDDILDEERKTFSADFQHHIAWGSRNDIVWGLGYRYTTSSTTTGALLFSLNPPDLNTQLFSTFVQDQIALLPDRLYVTVGTKLEHNYYTGFGLMPNARLSYSFNDRRMVWASVSRALRTPARTDTAERANFGGFTPPLGPPIAFSLFGNPNFKDETLIAYELGYRSTISRRLSIDISAFYHAYGDQETTEPTAPFFETTPGPPHEVMPLTFENLMQGEEHGIEASADWKVTSRWTISPAYDFARVHMRVRPESKDTTTAPETNGSDPHVQAMLRSHLELARGFSWDASAQFVDRLTAQPVPSYTRVDTQLNWRWKERFSLSLVGQNLAEDHHIEFIDPVGATRSTEIKRGAYGKVAWTF
jgi:iron complex outermembrane recepter protein